jgi:hypothetical protein
LRHRRKDMFPAHPHAGLRAIRPLLPGTELSIAIRPLVDMAAKPLALQLPLVRVSEGRGQRCSRLLGRLAWRTKSIRSPHRNRIRIRLIVPGRLIRGTRASDKTVRRSPTMIGVYSVGCLLRSYRAISALGTAGSNDAT